MNLNPTLARIVCLISIVTTLGALDPFSKRDLMAEPIGLMEKYALADDREAMLAELIPGSDEYYFYHCLHFQTRGQLERAEAIIKDWLAEHKGRETPAIRGMLDRQRLLTYGDSPQRTIDYLIKRLGINLNHAPPVVKGERRYPSQLNEAELAVDKLVQDALRRNDSLKPAALTYLAERFRASQTAGLKISLHEFLKRLDGPYVEKLDDLVVQELNGRKERDRRFGDVRAHSFLTLAELDRVAAAIPQVANDNAFVSARLHQLRPGGDQELSQQADVRSEYLKRVEAYARTLPQSYVSLKTCATYRLLEANLAQGIYDQDLFIRYLQLPRNSPIVHPVWARRPFQKASLGDDFMDMALLSPIGDEQTLVRTYLEHFLRDSRDTSAFAEYLKPEYLRRVFAETKLMAGIGDDAEWYKLLSAPQRQAIRDSVELTLAVQNKIQHADDELTELQVDVKNIDELVVRIYEINTLAYYRSHSKPLNTDLDLDGLVATHEQKLTYRQPAVERHRETIRLDEIQGRGVWIVDLVGKGVRARAIIRRGQLHHIDETVADGMLFTIVDENRRPIPGATMLVGSQETVANEQGRIVLSPVKDSVARRAVISDGKIATQITFDHLEESYLLSAGMHIDRTQLQSGGGSKLLVRPQVTMCGQIIDPSQLSDVSVLIEATDMDSLSTTIQLEQLKLNQNAELEIPFRVPPRLSALAVTLSGKIDGLSDGRNRSLTTKRTWDIAGIRKTSHTHDAFLTRDNDNYVIEVRGRTGESIAGATVSVSLQTELRSAPVDQTLQTDDQGRVQLGTLPGIHYVSYNVTTGLVHTRDLELDRVIWPSELHTAAGKAVRLPLAEEIDEPAKRYRLLEVRGGSYHADQSELLKVENGLLSIDPLPAGDYKLVDRDHNRQTQIIVVEGEQHGSVIAGKVRHRSVTPNQPLGIQSVQRGADGIRIQLSGDSRFARVHVYGSRYLDSTDPITHLQLELPRLFGRNVTLPRSGYVSGMRLGDEYQYVLRRRYAKKYPGVMLPQPSVILNPWETEETTNRSQTAAAGDSPFGAPTSEAAPKRESMSRRARQQALAGSSDFDFLADPGVIAANLVADENGVITVPADATEGLPIVQLLVVDPATILQRTVTGPLKDAETVDLRLAKSLEIDKALSLERSVSVVSKDKPLDMESIGSAQVQIYTNIASLFKLYKTLVDDPRLGEFDDLAYWHNFDQDQKLSAYSRLASHELHLFLWSHDPEFFDSVVRPYLANKKEKQFIDRWLLEEDLSDYAQLWHYNQLNAAERALLSLRLPNVRESVRRELREVVENQDINHQAIREQIEQALATRGLSRQGRAAGAEFDDFAMLGIDAGIVELHESEEMAELSDGISMGIMAKRKKRNLRFESRGESDKQQVKESLFGGRGGVGGGGIAGKRYDFYQELDSTKQWAESNWDRVRTVGGPAPSSLIQTNPFWSDLANRELDNIGVSSNLLRPIDNRHSVLLALAFSGLPLKAGDVGLPTEGDQNYSPEHPVALVTKRLTQLKPAEQESSILVGQRFALLSDKGNKKKTPPEPKEFLTGVAYRGQTVISNPTAERKLVDVFWQVPAGSLPIGGSHFTDSKTITLEPFAVQAIEYQFYFPMKGQFVHYPATVASEGTLLARGSEKTFTVLEQPTEDDQITWEKIARDGSAEQIRDFLAKANLRDLNWMLVAHRVKDQEIYKAIIEVLGNAKIPVSELWAYSLKHKDEGAMQSYLAMRDDLVGRVGPFLDSSLLSVNPIQRRTHELLEYAPLVRARIHRLGAENEIMNPTFLAQYRSFVKVLGYQMEMPAEERLVLTYYLILQNRIEEAIRHFDQIEREAVATRLQYDYVSAYLALHREDYDSAEKIASNYVNHPIPRWKNRFGDIVMQMQQRRSLIQTQQLVSVEDKDSNQKPIEEGSGDLAVLDRERRQAAATEQQPEVVVRVEGDSLRIDHRRAKDVTLNLYGVDLELLFSKAPFVREDLQRMAMVRPMRSDEISFDEATGVGNFQLDDELKRQTLLVEVVAGASRSTALYYGGQITTYVSESYGQLQTTDAKTHRPISTAYVKVYARYPNGSVKFYKDGYTDSRGRFDYASISASEARGASRFAILVMSEEKGATLHDVATPTQ